MRILKYKTDLSENDVTPKEIFMKRREFMVGSIALGASLKALSVDSPKIEGTPKWMQDKILSSKGMTNKSDDKLTPLHDVTSHNNFYEFGTHKAAPKLKSGGFKAFPWEVKVSGECAVTGTFDLEDLIKEMMIEERIYRLRCVEGWSMVIPWMGFSLASLIKKLQPTSNAKYIQFVTSDDKEQFPAIGSRFSTIDWPYREGLRMDEAMHDLSFMAIGLYGDALPAQNGAPLRLVVPWKYGFKSIKSIVEIRFVEEQPYTTWNAISDKEYGFYANVNPQVDHPRWSQATEKRLPSGLFSSNRIETKMFNGYPQVAGLYKGMDLKKYF
ncbi:MAG: protein-methionine-sulfoxide reductase catalytic subunit MsrP [Saccharospirillaceae bacterium]|nr:protein-methionine-sulfoxide reductase catalytic subunit MsrP [Pseudomonadales bacterium]NRB81397.1 protein-methionine-sulfoxide reductase catalytic subunit MsrP [Saccharospirillaceae bacterium]